MITDKSSIGIPFDRGRPGVRAKGLGVVDDLVVRLFDDLIIFTGFLIPIFLKMNSMKIYTLVLYLLIINLGIADLTAQSAENEAPITLTPQRDQQFQTIHNFGASDAWSCQFVGKNWPEEKKETIADLLFSTALKSDGSPAGIGLSAWRFNIGAGSAAQGDSSDIRDDWRRAEGFLQADGSINMDAQAGQRWFLQAAKERGVEEFIAFVNSPPVQLTKNGKAYSSDGVSGNLSPENYPVYVNFLTAVIKGLASHDDIQIDYISPFNEPQWDWKKPSQEGSPWKNSEIAAITKLLDSSLQENKLATRIEIPETAQIDYLYREHNRPGRGNQIAAFFDPESENYLADLQHVAPKVAGHSYFSTWELQDLIEKRQALAKKLQQYPQLEYWMSEYTLLENNPEVKGNGRDLGIDPALYMARVIHTDLTVAQASAWQWWLAISPYNYKDGLVYIEWTKLDGEFFESKLLWALGNFARFIRPGMVRIALDRSDNPILGRTLSGLMTSAYLDPETGKTVVVAVNYGSAPRSVKLTGSRRSSKFSSYRTSATENLQYLGKNKATKIQELPARSITTFVEE